MRHAYITLFAVLSSLMMMFPRVVVSVTDDNAIATTEKTHDDKDNNFRGLQIWPLPIIGNKNNNKIKRHYGGGGGGHRGGGGRGGGGRGGGHRRKDTISGRSECVECKQRYSSSKCQQMRKCGGGRRDGDRDRDRDRREYGDGDRDRDGKWTSWKTGKSCKYGKSYCKNNNRRDRNCKYNKYGRKSCKYSSSPKGGDQNYREGRNNNRNRGD